MKTNAQTTFILLERGEEDKRLWREIDKLVYAYFKGYTKQFFTEFPTLGQLQQGLKNEIAGQNEEY